MSEVWRPGQRTQQETAFSEPGNKLSPDTELACALISDFPASRTVSNTFLFLYKPLSL